MHKSTSIAFGFVKEFDLHHEDLFVDKSLQTLGKTLKTAVLPTLVGDFWE